MKVVAFNGSPKKEGNTYHALKLVLDELEIQGIETELIHIGSKSLQSCNACGLCFKNHDEKCVLNDDVNDWIQKMRDADGILFGSPVHFSSISSNMKIFLDRAIFVQGPNKNMFRHKVGAAVVAVRRAGGVAAFNQLNNYINYSEMLMPNSNYWNVIYGSKPGEALQDEEGKQILRILAKNMAWLIKIIDYGKDKIEAPEFEGKVSMNFIR
ncbi:MAG: flavodoxin family protein [Clostridiaceae bacterium]